jgi:hypothetical protein
MMYAQFLVNSNSVLELCRLISVILTSSKPHIQRADSRLMAPSWLEAACVGLSSSALLLASFLKE